MEEKNIIALDGWKLEAKEYLSENGFSSQRIELCYITIDGAKVCKKYDIIVQSEHYILTSKFAIKRDSWKQQGIDGEGYMDLYEILTKLEEHDQKPSREKQ